MAQPTYYTYAKTHPTVASVTKLLDSGLDPNAVGDGHETILHRTVKYLFYNAGLPNEVARIVSVIKLLLERGADPNKKAYAGFAPLHDAVLTNNTDVVKLLLDNGADVNIKNKAGVTPLHIAVETKQTSPKMITILIARGADPKAANSAGKTPLDLDKAGKLLDMMGVRGASEIGIAKNLPPGPGPVSNIQEFLVGKKPVLPDTKEGRLQREENLKKKGARRTRLRKTQRRKSLRRK